MESLNLLQQLEELIDQSTKIPLGSKIMLDKTLALELIRDIRISLPDQVKQADWINSEKQHILEEAEKEAQKKLVEAQKQADELTASHTLTVRAEERGREIVEEAQKKAADVKEGAKEYALEMLGKLDADLAKINARVQKNMQELRDFNL